MAETEDDPATEALEGTAGCAEPHWEAAFALLSPSKTRVDWAETRASIQETEGSGELRPLFPSPAAREPQARGSALAA